VDFTTPSHTVIDSTNSLSSTLEISTSTHPLDLTSSSSDLIFDSLHSSYITPTAHKIPSTEYEDCIMSSIENNFESRFSKFEIEGSDKQDKYSGDTCSNDNLIIGEILNANDKIGSGDIINQECDSFSNSVIKTEIIPLSILSPQPLFSPAIISSNSPNSPVSSSNLCMLPSPRISKLLSSSNLNKTKNNGNESLFFQYHSSEINFHSTPDFFHPVFLIFFFFLYKYMYTISCYLFRFLLILLMLSWLHHHQLLIELFL
jgi:hypothetical protein